MEINNQLETLLKSRKEGIDFKLFIYEVTKMYPISEGYLKRRLERMQELNLINVEGDLIKWQA